MAWTLNMIFFFYSYDIRIDVWGLIVLLYPNIVNHEFWKLLFPNTYLGYHVCHSWNCFGFTLRYCIAIIYPFYFLFFFFKCCDEKPLILPFFWVRLTAHFLSLISLNGSIPNRTCIAPKIPKFCFMPNNYYLLYSGILA